MHSVKTDLAHVAWDYTTQISIEVLLKEVDERKFTKWSHLCIPFAAIFLGLGVLFVTT